MREVALLSRKGAAGSRRGDTVNRNPHYWAFLSYSHKDSEVADWLHGALERYRVPRVLVGRETARGTIPASFTPIFRDRHELAASGDLGHTIREALAQTRCLIVLCSPDAAQSRWTNEEILAFKKLHPGGCVIAAIVAGEPFASESKGRKTEECFPPALRQKFDSRGRATGKRAEPIAADLREAGDGRQLGLLKIIAGLLGVGLDDLVQREQQRRNKRLTYIAAASLAGMTVTSGLAIFAFDSRNEARDQRREAEGLIGFMLGDLRKELEPINKLSALDAVGARALKYFENQNKGELSDAALLQRSRALTLMGEIAQTRGDPNGALARYREAMAGTGEMVRRVPDDPQRLFDHAQNVFWVGSIAMQRGELERAEAAFRQYKLLAERMVAIDPRNVKYQLEAQYADSNLGVILYERRRYKEAAQLFGQSLRTTELLAAAEPDNEDHKKSMLEALAWLSDAQFGEGRMDEAIAKRERQVALIEELGTASQDVEYRRKAIPARRALGRLLTSRGSARAGLEQVERAVEISQSLISAEPDNMTWVELGAGARLELSGILLAGDQVERAAAQARAGCDLVERLLQRDRTIVLWQGLSVDCLNRKARVAAASASLGEAGAVARQALAAARALRSGNAVSDAVAVSSNLKLIGDIQSRSGDRAGSARSWRAALDAWPKNIPETPRQMAIRAGILKSLGSAESRAIETRLDTMGYRRLI